MYELTKTFSPLQYITIKATVDIPAHRFVGANGNITVINGIPVGITENDWRNKDMISVMTFGVGLVEAGSTIAVGDSVGVGVNGKAAACSELVTNCVAIALSNATTGGLVKLKFPI